MNNAGMSVREKLDSVADLAALAAEMPAVVKPKKLRNRHDDLAAARALKGMITGQ